MRIKVQTVIKIVLQQLAVNKFAIWQKFAKFGGILRNIGGVFVIC